MAAQGDEMGFCWGSNAQRSPVVFTSVFFVVLLGPEIFQEEDFKTKNLNLNFLRNFVRSART